MTETLLFAGTDGSGSCSGPRQPRCTVVGVRAPQPSRGDTEAGQDRVKSARRGRRTGERCVFAISLICSGKMKVQFFSKHSLLAVKRILQRMKPFIEEKAHLIIFNVQKTRVSSAWAKTSPSNRPAGRMIPRSLSGQWAFHSFSCPEPRANLCHTQGPRELTDSLVRVTTLGTANGFCFMPLLWCWRARGP